MSFSAGLALVYKRDITRLMQQVEAFPDDQTLWKTLPGVTNSAGNLVLHLEGNLREFIERLLGGREFQRNRPLEFSATGLAKADLAERINQLIETIPAVIAELSTEQMEAPYPEDFLGGHLSTTQMLVHLNGHLGFHLGQIDYLRRILTGNGAIAHAGLK